MKVVAVLFAVASLALLSGCGEEKTGPEKVHFDREACEMCRMLISDPRFVTQVRGGPNRALYKFDDIGDALHWLIKQDWKNDKTTEIWVADMTSQKTIKWLEAKKAYFIAGQMTPMNYGYGALAEMKDGAVPFITMKDKILGAGNNLICDVPGFGTKKGPENHIDEDHERHMKDPNHKHDPAHHMESGPKGGPKEGDKK